MASKTQIVTEAREWIGTPFLHGQSVKGQFADCAGVVMGILRECKMLTPEQVSAFHSGAPRIVPDGYFRQRLEEVCCQVDTAQTGDLLLFAVGGVEQHLALCVGKGRMIHSLATLGKAAEQDISDAWRQRLAGVFRVRRAR